MSGLTMVTGVMGAVAQNHMRRLLSFHIISQIGYPLMGLGIFTPLGLGAAIFFLIHIILVKATLFFVNGIAAGLSGTNDLKKMGGLYQNQPLLAALFLIPALSLAGIPPFSGFFAKLALVRAGIETSQYAIVIISLIVSILTLFSMIKIWGEAFWKRSHEDETEGCFKSHISPDMVVLTTIGAVVLIGILSLATGFVFDISLEAGNQLLNPSQYIDTVLGER
jgi:multicomponent Na+:H+ antiporter subunit D